MPRQALLVVNRHSRRGGAALDPVLARLADGGLLLEEADVPAARRVGEAIAARARGKDLVILGGGDGTMNMAAEALLRTGLPLAILPLGTANDLARTLGIPADPLRAAEAIQAGRTRRIDLGRVNAKHFFNVASLGMSVRVAKALEREVKQRLGVLSYPVAVWRVVHEARPFAVTIKSPEGSWTTRSIQLAVGNGRHYGGGMTVDEDARIDDHLLHLYSLKPQSLAKLILRLPALRRGRHDDPSAVLDLAGPEFEVVTERPMRINTDGEITTATPARFSVVPAALEVVVP